MLWKQAIAIGDSWTIMTWCVMKCYVELFQSSWWCYEMLCYWKSSKLPIFSDVIQCSKYVMKCYEMLNIVHQWNFIKSEIKIVNFMVKVYSMYSVQSCKYTIFSNFHDSCKSEKSTILIKSMLDNFNS